MNLTIFSRSALAAICTVALVVCAPIMPSKARALSVEGITPINNRAYTPAVRKLFQTAKNSIYVQLYQARYYEQYPDTASNHFLEDLIAARGRGVEVYIVIDTGDWNPSNKNDYNVQFVDRLTTSGCHVWEDNGGEVSHQKIITIDDDVSVVGSVNWTFYALDKNNEVAAVVRSQPLNAWFRRYFWQRCAGGKPHANAQPVTYGDVDRLVPPVAGAEADSNKPDQVTETLAEAAAAAAGEGATTGTTSAAAAPAAASAPGTELPAADIRPVANRLFYPVVRDAILNARESIVVVQRELKMASRGPSSIGDRLPGQPSNSIMVLCQELAAAAKRGVKVRVVIDQTTDFESADNDESAAWLRDHGIEVLRDELENQTHAKFLLIDRDKTIIGSTNWTREAVEDGNEASVLITSPQVNAAYMAFVNSIIAKGGPYQIVKKSIWNSTPAPAKK